MDHIAHWIAFRLYVFNISQLSSNLAHYYEAAFHYVSDYSVLHQRFFFLTSVKALPQGLILESNCQWRKKPHGEHLKTLESFISLVLLNEPSSFMSEFCHPLKFTKLEFLFPRYNFLNPKSLTRYIISPLWYLWEINQTSSFLGPPLTILNLYFCSSDP